MSADVPKPDIVLVESPLEPAELRRLVTAHFEDMVMIGRGEPLE